VNSDFCEFLNALFGEKPDELFTLLWTLPDKRSHWFQSIEDAIRFAESCADRDLYVGVGLSPADNGPGRRCVRRRSRRHGRSLGRHRP
jgi:hypothetical protein